VSFLYSVKERHVFSQGWAAEANLQSGLGSPVP
jgi:hypothetical protein